jgi:hypothetical protein
LLEKKNMDLIATSQVTKASKVTFMCSCNVMDQIRRPEEVNERQLKFLEGT